jgi:hypothetical protein
MVEAPQVTPVTLFLVDIAATLATPVWHRNRGNVLIRRMGLE